MNAIVIPGPGESEDIIMMPDETAEFSPGDRLFIRHCLSFTK